MNAHRVEVLDRADDHDVVATIADHLQLELVPADERLLDEHLADRALAQTELDLAPKLCRARCEAAAVTAERECRANDCRERDVREIVERGDDPGDGNGEAAALHRGPEELAILGAANHVDRGAEQLDPERLEHALLRQLDREVESGLPAERRQERVGPLPAEHVRDALEVERLEIRAVGEAGVGHDRGGVRVDDDRPEAVLPEHLERLAAGVVELAGLADHDRPRADQADRAKVDSLRHRSHLVEPALEDRPRVVWAGAGLGMELDGAGLELWEVEALHGLVVERDVGRLARIRRRNREAVVLARHEHAAAGPLEHRMVRAAMTERQLVRLVAGREAEELMAEADPEDRHPPEQLLHRLHLVVERLRIAGTVGEDDGVVLRELVRGDGAGCTCTCAPAPASRRRIERLQP